MSTSTSQPERSSELSGFLLSLLVSAVLFPSVTMPTHNSSISYEEQPS